MVRAQSHRVNPGVLVAPPSWSLERKVFFSADETKGRANVSWNGLLNHFLTFHAQFSGAGRFADRLSLRKRQTAW
jgi:hypothetical protein